MTTWTVAITTAPRREPTLQSCVDSVRAAGWNPVVFAEPHSPLSNATTFLNHKQLGVWYNWLQAAKWCLEQKTDAILLLQDDVEIHPESKSFVEARLWPRNCGYISLYTPKHYQETFSGADRPPGFYEIETQSMWGACALVFHPQILRRLVDHPRCVSWLGARPKEDAEAIMDERARNPHTIKQSDIVIGMVLRRFLRKRLMYFNPSLARHTSVYSSCGHGTNTNKRNAKIVADFSKPLAEQIP